MNGPLSIFEERATLKTAELPNNCQRCGARLTSEDMMYLCDLCWLKEEKRRLNQDALLKNTLEPGIGLR